MSSVMHSSLGIEICTSDGSMRKFRWNVESMSHTDNADICRVEQVMIFD